MFLSRVTVAIGAAIGLYVSSLPVQAASAPAAFSVFCANYPAQCLARGPVAPVVMDAARWTQLRAVNAEVNRSIRDVPDRSKGSADRWSILPGGGGGDCEDYALTKRAKLMNLGWPSSALLITVVRLRSGEGHAVLTVRTDEGDLVLDNLRSSIKAPTATGYRYFTRQSPANPRAWVAISRDGGTTAVAAAKNGRTPSRVAGGSRTGIQSMVASRDRPDFGMDRSR